MNDAHPFAVFSEAWDEIGYKAYELHDWGYVRCPICWDAHPCDHSFATWLDGHGWMQVPSGVELYLPIEEMQLWLTCYGQDRSDERWSKLGPFSKFILEWAERADPWLTCTDFEVACHALNIPLSDVTKEFRNRDLLQPGRQVVYFASSITSAHITFRQAWDKMEMELGNVWLNEPSHPKAPRLSLRWKGRGCDGERPPSGAYLYKLIARWASRVQGTKTPDGTWEFLCWAMEGRVVRVLAKMESSGVTKFEDAARTIRQIEKTLEWEWWTGVAPWHFLRQELIQEEMNLRNRRGRLRKQATARKVR